MRELYELLQMLTIWMMEPKHSRIPQLPRQTDRWITLTDLPTQLFLAGINRYEVAHLLNYGVELKVLEFYLNPITGELGLHLITNRFGAGADAKLEESKAA